MMFTCFRDGKCEWLKGLKDFTSQFNEEFGENYDLSQCLDISDSSKKQPEVLLESSGSVPMVIECKKIVCPPDYYKNHRTFHDVFSCLQNLYREKLEPKLKNGAYRLWIEKDDLYKIKKKDILKVLSQILDQIEHNIKVFEKHQRITGKIPVAWCFELVNDDEYESGIGLSCMQYRDTPSINWPNIEKEVSDQIQKYLKSASAKFKPYNDCLKVLVVELCGDIWSLPLPDQLGMIINSMAIPSEVDQIWLAIPEDEIESQITYCQMFSKR